MASQGGQGQASEPERSAEVGEEDAEMTTDESRSPRAAATTTAGQAAALIATSPKGVVTLRSTIVLLKQEQTAAIAKQKEVAKELRNHCRRNKRLREKVLGLTDEDMVDVLRMRVEKRKRSWASFRHSPVSPAQNRALAQLKVPLLCAEVRMRWG